MQGLFKAVHVSGDGNHCALFSHVVEGRKGVVEKALAGNVESAEGEVG